MADDFTPGDQGAPLSHVIPSSWYSSKSLNLYRLEHPKVEIPVNLLWLNLDIQVVSTSARIGGRTRELDPEWINNCLQILSNYSRERLDYLKANGGQIVIAAGWQSLGLQDRHLVSRMGGGEKFGNLSGYTVVGNSSVIHPNSLPNRSYIVQYNSQGIQTDPTIGSHEVGHQYRASHSAQFLEEYQTAYNLDKPKLDEAKNRYWYEQYDIRHSKVTRDHAAANLRVLNYYSNQITTDGGTLLYSEADVEIAALIAALGVRVSKDGKTFHQYDLNYKPFEHVNSNLTIKDFLGIFKHMTDVWTSPRLADSN